MTSPPDPTVPAPSEDDVDSAIVTRAARQLGARSGRRALEIADDVLLHVLAQPRRSMPVRARGADSNIHVSEQVVTTMVSRAVNAGCRDLAVGRVVVTAGPDQRVDHVLVELIARYGADLVAATGAARTLAHAALLELLGPSGGELGVVVTHLHVGGVTLGDPQVVDPADERPVLEA